MSYNRHSRFPYTQEQNLMLINIIKQIKSPIDNLSWKLITKYFNDFFPDTHRTPFQLKKHYQETLNPNLNHDHLTEKEKEIIIYQINQEQNTIKNLGKLGECSIDLNI
jgi:hypothetical protein